VEVDLISGFDLGEWRDRVSTPDDVPCFVTAEEQVSWGGINNFSRWDRYLVRERRERDMRGKGLGLICHFAKALRDRRIPLFTDQETDRLAVDRERVTGVVMNGGQVISARRGVILATGAYSANPKMNWDFEQLPGIAQEASSLAPPSLTGDGLVLGAEVGGMLHKIENSLRVMLSYTIPPDAPGQTATCVHAGIVELCSPHTMVVNRAGRRFADETFFQGIVPKLRFFDPIRHEYTNLPAYLIFDAQYARQYSFANRPAGSEVPKAVPRAANLRELAAKLGIDGDRLVREAERFNGFVSTGADEDFHRGETQWKLAAAKGTPGANASLGTVEEPPFYGIELHPTGASSVGLRANGSGQVIHQRCHPIAGLYASGNVAAATEHGIGYQAGLSLAAAMTFSYLAVRHMIESQ
jgi:3-oxosteroid 1-dehydrogenase